MLKTGGKDSAFGEAAQQQASAALASAADDLVALHAKRLEQEQRQWAPGAAPVFIKDKKVNRPNSDDDSQDDSDDDNDPVLRSLREKRLQELKNQFAARQAKLSQGHGEYRLVDECDFLKEVTGSERLVCHFFHRDFERCKITDQHLMRIAPNHPDTKFIRVDAEKAPFFVHKLAIRIMPTVIVFNDGVAIDRIIGFQDLGGKDDFQTAVLVKRLAKAGAFEDSKEGRRKVKPVKTLL